MKLLKMFGLVALAALMVMAFVGAGPAMAESTALCANIPPYDLADEDPTDLPDRDGLLAVCNNLVTHVHETTLSGAKAKLLSKAINVECDVLFLGDVLGLATPQVIHSGAFTYTNCNTGCTVTQEGTALISVLRLGHETADVAYEYQVHVECGAFIDCKYNGTGLKGTAKGPLLSSHLNGETTITEQTANKVGGAFCPSTAKLDITVTPLTHTWIGS
jgi:hypothetical protein